MVRSNGYVRTNLLSHSLVELTETDASEHLLGVVGEVAAQYPCKVTWVLGQDFCHVPTFIFTEVEHFVLAWFAFLVEEYIALRILHLLPNDATCEIHVVVLLGESSQLVHVVVEHTIWLFLYAWGILVELAHQYTIGSLGVLVGTVSLEVFLHLSATEELIGCGKVAALHLHEDGLRIDETTF